MVPEESAAHVIAWHRDLDGRLLDTSVASVELINLLRPIVAVAWYVTFAALVLHEYSETRQRVVDGDPGAAERFVQEVRRFYPFFPFVGGRVVTPSSGPTVMVDVTPYVGVHQPDSGTPECLSAGAPSDGPGESFTGSGWRSSSTPDWRYPR
jgi:hypothetical protein